MHSSLHHLSSSYMRLLQSVWYAFHSSVPHYVLIDLDINYRKFFYRQDPVSYFHSFFFCFLLYLFGELISCISEFKEHGKAISRGGYDGVFSFANFKQDRFSYLNITVLEKRLVDQMPECSFACLKTPPCFSFNLNAFPDIDNKLHCELLPADKYNNTDEFIFSNFSHHFSITVSWVVMGKWGKLARTQLASLNLSHNPN